MNTIDINGKQMEYIEHTRSLEQKYQWQWRAQGFTHNILHIIIFVGAVILPFLLQLKVDTLIITIVSAMVAVAAALTQFFQFGDRRRIYRLERRSRIAKDEALQQESSTTRPSAQEPLAR
jgi:Protein of unknown function (DUF4231)